MKLELVEIFESKNVYDLLSYSYKYLMDIDALERPGSNNQRAIYQLFSIYFDNLVISSEFKKQQYFNDLMVDIKSELSGAKGKASIIGILFSIIFSIDELFPFEFPLQTDDNSSIKLIDIPHKFSDEFSIYPIFCQEKTLIGYFSKQIKLRKKDHYNSNNIGDKLVNFKIIKKDRLENYIPRIYGFIDGDIFYKQVKTEEHIKIGLAPITGEKIEKFFIKNIIHEDNLFEFNGIKSFAIMGQLVDNYKKILKNAILNKIDILVFPEMMFFNEAIKPLEEILEKENFINGLPVVKLIFCGFEWINQENICHVLSYNGTEIITQKKKKCFSYIENDITYSENLNLKDKLFNILDINGIGRILTCICLDFIEGDLQRIFSLVAANIIVVPAYSPSFHKLAQNAKVLATKNIISIISNCCSPVCNHKPSVPENEIGGIFMPAKSKTENISNSHIYKETNSCWKKCNICDRIFTFSIQPYKIINTNNMSFIKVDD